MPSAECEDVEVDTQYRTGHGIPDIKISGENFCVFVEVKVEAAVDTGQLKRYQKALGQEDGVSKSRQRLVLLTKFKPSKEKVPRGVKALIWREISGELQELRKKCRSVYGRFLIDQFVGFVERPKFFVKRKRSKLSRELRAYMKTRGDKSIFESGFNWASIESAKLNELYDLLGLMLKATKGLGNWRATKVTSHRWGWIGINLNYQLYWAYLMIEDGAYHYWQDYIDLETDTDYFEESSSPNDRLQILKEFFEESLEYADKTWGRGR